MSSAGIAKGGGGLVPLLQQQWALAVEGNLQAHEDKADLLAGMAHGTAEAIRSSLLWPVRVAVASLALLAASSVVVAAVQVAALFRPVVEVIR